MFNSFRTTLALSALCIGWYMLAPSSMNAGMGKVKRAPAMSSASTCNTQGTVALTVSDTPT